MQGAEEEVRGYAAVRVPLYSFKMVFFLSVNLSSLKVRVILGVCRQLVTAKLQ